MILEGTNIAVSSAELNLPKNIVNTDKKGECYNLLPTIIYIIKTEKCLEGRIALLCVQIVMEAEKLPPLLIVQFKLAKCFKNVQMLAVYIITILIC